MKKNEMLKIFRNLKKQKSMMYLALTKGENDFPDFFFFHKDKNFFCSSYHPKTGTIKAAFGVGADEVEYLTDAIKDAPADEELFLTHNEEEMRLVLQSRENIYYKATRVLTEESFEIPKVSVGFSQKALPLKKNLQLLLGLMDTKGYASVPFLYLSFAEDVRFFTFSAWVGALFVLSQHTEKKLSGLFQIRPDEIKRAVSFLPTGKTMDVSIEMSETSLLFSFEGCSVLLPMEKASLPEEILQLFSFSSEKEMVLDREKLKSMLGKMTGVFGSSDGAFIHITKEENEGFVKISVDNKTFYKVPCLGGELLEVSVYGKYLKDSATKMDGENIRILQDKDFVKTSSEMFDTLTVSMKQREEALHDEP